MVAMRILQLVVDGAGYYERKSSAIDSETLPPHEVESWRWDAGGYSRDSARVRRSEFLRHANASDVVHVYAPATIPVAAVRGVTVPYVSEGEPVRSRWRWHAAAAPALQLESDEATTVPEAVSEAYRAAGPREQVASEPRRFVIGTFGPQRRDVRRLCEGTLTRIARFRDDIDWDLHDEPPAAGALKQVDVWVDPTTDAADRDGMVAEAQSVGIITVATRTPVNTRRLAGGLAGFLVPVDDPNELAHSIVNALFRPEMTLAKLSAVRAGEWYAPSRRAARLLELYERAVHEAHR